MNNLKDFANDTVIKDLALECKQYMELIPRLYDDLAAVKKAHKEAVEFNYDLAEENTAVHTKTIAMQERISALEKVSALYHELLYQVGMKFPNETRHETALRYLQRAEKSDDQCQAGATRSKGDE